jgi:ABC-2 type transport system ATP-binding protein
MSENVIELKELRKVYRTPFRRKRVEAVKGITLSVKKGEVFGFLGPNGAGKTTTIRVLMGLVSPTSGEATVLGRPIADREASRRLGFLPEAPYFYDYLTVREMLDLVGRLFGLDRSARAKRTEELIALVGLSHAADTPLKKYSKGMLQRAGLAQALVNDPELVVFDEPMGGLDPVGRKEVRDIIYGLRDSGKTVFFSSHILADVEMICDRVAILSKGEVHHVGLLADLVEGAVTSTDIVFRVDADFPHEEAFSSFDVVVRKREREVSISVSHEGSVDAILRAGLEKGAKIVSVTPHHETLEDVFIRLTEAAAEAEESA